MISSVHTRELVNETKTIENSVPKRYIKAFPQHLLISSKLSLIIALEPVFI